MNLNGSEDLFVWLSISFVVFIVVYFYYLSYRIRDHAEILKISIICAIMWPGGLKFESQHSPSEFHYKTLPLAF